MRRSAHRASRGPSDSCSSGGGNGGGCSDGSSSVDHCSTPIATAATHTRSHIIQEQKKHPPLADPEMKFPPAGTSSSKPALSTRRFRSKRQQPRIPVVETIGELSTKQIFLSLTTVGPSTTVRFDYTGQDEAYVLCWMDEKGKKHHFYRHSGNEWSHQEHTCVGHAFAIFRKRDGKLLASYRPRAGFVKDQVHVIVLSSSQLPMAKIETVLSEARVMAVVSPIPEFPSDQPWVVSYGFTVPPLPRPTRADFFKTDTFYVWGDLSFDEFPLGSRNPVHDYKMNQIVPQVMCGACLCGSDPDTFQPRWGVFERWVAQAQHYYQTEEGEELGSRAVCGKLFDVEPGERMRTTIHFTGDDMVIRIASETRPEHFSEVTTHHPFPNNVKLFPGGWREFFKSKERPSTKTFLAEPCFNIEYKARKVDLNTLASLCPFQIFEATYPGSKRTWQQWTARGMNFEIAKPMISFVE